MSALRRSTPFLVLATMQLTLASAPSQSTTLRHKTEADLVRESELIFRGTVSQVAYRLSDRQADSDARIPFTFVTFRIATIFKGRVADADSITLRFAGGHAGGTRYLRIPGIPLFDPGDQDVLFVLGNGRRLCPLVGWSQGRFRIIDGAVYSNAGEEVWLTKDQRILLGAGHPLKEVMSDTIGPAVFARTSSDVTRKAVPQMTGQRMTPDSFGAVIPELVRTLCTADELAKLPMTRSSRIQDALAFKTPQASLKKGGEQ